MRLIQNYYIKYRNISNSRKFNSHFDYYYCYYYYSANDGFLSNIPRNVEYSSAWNDHSPSGRNDTRNSQSHRSISCAERQIARKVIKDGMKYV